MPSMELKAELPSLIKLESKLNESYNSKSVPRCNITLLATFYATNCVQADSSYAILGSVKMGALLRATRDFRIEAFNN